jgi:hypothetical protein
MGSVWALLNVLASGLSPVSLWLLGLSFFLRLAQAMTVGAEVLGDHEVLANLWLLPVRDAIAMGLWVAGFAGNTIVWRGERFALKNGWKVDEVLRVRSQLPPAASACSRASASHGFQSKVRHVPNSLKSLSQRGRSSLGSAVSA